MAKNYGFIQTRINVSAKDSASNIQKLAQLSDDHGEVSFKTKDGIVTYDIGPRPGAPRGVLSKAFQGYGTEVSKKGSSAGGLWNIHFRKNPDLIITRRAK